MIPTPSPATIIVIVGTISILGLLFDKFVLSSRMKEWRLSVYELWVKLNTPKARDLVIDANCLYCDLFDRIYGTRAFAWRRVWSSFLSSIISLVVIVLIIGYEQTTFFNDALQFTILLPLLNLVPDFFSLAETRLVLQWSKRASNLLVIILFFGLDFVLTTIIFFLFYLLLLPFILVLTKSSSLYTVMVAIFQGLFRRTSSLFMLSRSLPFFLTTFVTSLFWWLFVFTFGIIWILHRLYPFANFVYREIGQSDKPALVSSAFLNSLVIIVYGLWRLIEWLVIRF